MNIKNFITAISLVFLLAGCSDEQEEQPEEIKIEMVDFGITETIVEDGVITGLMETIDQAEWQALAPEMAGEPMAIITFINPAADASSMDEMRYEIWFNKKTSRLEILGSEEDREYGTLSEKNSQALSTLILENTVEKFSMRHAAETERG